MTQQYWIVQCNAHATNHLSTGGRQTLSSLLVCTSLRSRQTFLVGDEVRRESSCVSWHITVSPTGASRGGFLEIPDAPDWFTNRKLVCSSGIPERNAADNASRRVLSQSGNVPTLGELVWVQKTGVDATCSSVSLLLWEVAYLALRIAQGRARS